MLGRLFWLFLQSVTCSAPWLLSAGGWPRLPRKSASLTLQHKHMCMLARLFWLFLQSIHLLCTLLLSICRCLATAPSQRMAPLSSTLHMLQSVKCSACWLLAAHLQVLHADPLVLAC
jgi:hypothetical protein